MPIAAPSRPSAKRSPVPIGRSSSPPESSDSNPGEVATEHDGHDDPEAARRMGGPQARRANAETTLAFAARGVRSSIVRLAPTVHGDGDTGFVAMLVAIARDKGASGYIGDGSNRWPAAHRRDAASLFQLALEDAPAGSTLHGIAEEGVAIRDIAAVIGRHLDLPVVSIAPDDAAAHFGWMGALVALDSPASNALTRELVGWQPTHPGLIADLDEDHYFHQP